MKYDVIIIGAGPGGIFSAYELVQQNPDLKIAVFESGHPLEKRHCPIDGDKIKSCINCKSFSVVPVLFPMENTISPTLSVALSTSISAGVRPST